MIENSEQTRRVVAEYLKVLTEADKEYEETLAPFVKAYEDAQRVAQKTWFLKTSDARQAYRKLYARDSMEITLK